MRARSFERPVSVIRVALLAILGSVLLGCAARDAQPVMSGEDRPPPSRKQPPQLAPSVIQAGVRDGGGKSLQACYEAGLVRDPKLGGRVAVHFIINNSGRVEAPEVIEGRGSEHPPLTDPQVLECILDVYRGLEFPAFSGDVITVVYPILFAPEKSPAASNTGETSP